MATNDLQFVRGVVDSVRMEGLDVWVFGGWAEELRGARAPGTHADVDLLLRATSFEELEAVLTDLPGVKKIPEKCFSHKRAFVWNGVRVEFLLAQPGAPDTTIMYGGRVMVRWPADTFTGEPADELPIAGREALTFYRLQHDQIEQAYRESRLTTGGF